MTGGQDATGALPVPRGGHASWSPRASSEVIITTDEPRKYRGVTLPART